MAIKKGAKDLLDRYVGTTKIEKVMRGTELIWESIKWIADMVHTTAYTATANNDVHNYPDTTVIKARIVGTDASHETFKAKYHLTTIDNGSSTGDTLKTDVVVNVGDVLIIRKNDDSMVNLTVSTVTESGGVYTVDTASATNGEVPTLAYAVSNKISIEGVQASLASVGTPIKSDVAGSSGSKEFENTNGAPWTVPEGVTEISYCIIGSGGSGGGACSTTSTVIAKGGYAGQIKSGVLDVSNEVELIFTAPDGGRPWEILGSSNNTHNGSDGEATIIESSSTGTTLVSASGGKAGFASISGTPSQGYEGNGVGTSNCYQNNLRDGGKAYVSSTKIAWGGQAGFDNGGQAYSTGSYINVYNGAGGAGSIRTNTSGSNFWTARGGAGHAKITWTAPDKKEIEVEVFYSEVKFPQTASVSASATILHKDDIIQELRGSIKG